MDNNIQERYRLHSGESRSLGTNYITAWRIDSSIRPEIHVNDLEQADHTIFDITIPGILIQSIFSVLGYSWMYALTRRSKLSLLAAVPAFALNILHAATHTLCEPLDVFVRYPIRPRSMPN